MTGAVADVLKQLTSTYKSTDCDEATMVVDSMPIMTSTGRNCVGKLDMEITDKGYCSTKNMYYHGLNQHLVGYRRKGGGRSRSLSAASENDLSVSVHFSNQLIFSGYLEDFV